MWGEAHAGLRPDGWVVGGRCVTISAPAAGRSDTVWPEFLKCPFFFYGILSTTRQGGSNELHNLPHASRKLPIPGGLAEARGTSFASPLVAGIVARMKEIGIGGGTNDGAEVEAIRTELRNTADRLPEFPDDPEAAPFDHPWVGVVVYDYDGEREGIAQAPAAPAP